MVECLNLLEKGFDKQYSMWLWCLSCGDLVNRMTLRFLNFCNNYYIQMQVIYGRWRWRQRRRIICRTKVTKGHHQS